jgi:hypothetical protein
MKKESMYFNPETKKNQDLFETLNPVFAIRCDDPNVVIGNRGASIKIIVEAKNEEQAIKKAMLDSNFTKYLRMSSFEKEFLEVYKPSGLYVIGKVDYFEGDERA